jgi:excisionase family DNA binding protein
MTVQDRSDFVSVAEAARQLGVSTATVKRRIAAGTLEAEQLQRPQGYEYRVRLTRDVSAPFTERSDSEPAAPLAVTTHDVSAAITAAVAPLVERLAVQDGAIEGQAGIIRDLERENGRLSAELATLTAAHAALIASQSPPEAPGSTGAPDLTMA